MPARRLIVSRANAPTSTENALRKAFRGAARGSPNPPKSSPKSSKIASGALLGDRGRAGRVLGRAEDAPGTLPRRSGGALGEPRAPQGRPGTLQERARDAPETLRRRPGTRSRRRTALKTSADRFSSVFRMTRDWAEMRFDMVFTIRNADRAFCATGASEQRWRTKNEPFRPPETKPGGGRAPKFERKKRKNEWERATSSDFF